MEMVTFATDIETSIHECDVVWAANETWLSKSEKVIRIVRVACDIFVYFLEIHPYANGNGHMARFILTAILGRYGLWLSKWTIEARPADPPYSGAIKSYRDGNRINLERFVLSCI